MSGDQQVFQNAMNLGHSAAWDQDWGKASSYYRIAIDEFPENISALSSLALALYELQKYPEALEYYQRVAKLTPIDPVPAQRMAEIYERSGDQVNAEKSYIDVAELYARNKDVEKAIKNWSRVGALDPEHMAAHTRLALVYERLGRTGEAMTEYIAIASLLQYLGNVQKAIQTLKHALQVVPNSKEANQALTILLNGNPLQRPSQPRGGTNPLTPSQVSIFETSRSIEEDRPRLDPIQDAKQKALTDLK